ncbi:MAG: ribosomal protein S18-alanine N-acetyltransferase [bacterium]
MKIRKMEIDDISRVTEIEAESFSRPWSEEMIYRDLTEHSPASFYVAEDEGEVVGHISVWRSPDDIHLTTLAVAPERRREGIASALVQKIIEEHSSQRPEIVLEVRESNRPALELYQKFGFEIRERRIQYYVDNGEDAFVMVYNCREKAGEIADETTRTGSGCT